MDAAASVRMPLDRSRDVVTQDWLGQGLPAPCAQRQRDLVQEPIAIGGPKLRRSRATSENREQRQEVGRKTRVLASACADTRQHGRSLRVAHRLPLKKDWESLVEMRALTTPDLSDKRTGILVVSRYLNPHFEVGVAFNFDDFSDDLTDLSCDHKGTFLSLTGAL